MQIIALKHLPQGQKPGDLVDLPQAAAQLFIDIGAARAATADECGQQSSASSTTAAGASNGRRRYQRRDMQADA